jgi:hypothetical protein
MPLLAAPGRTPSYLVASRSPRYSILFALPLLLAYEGLALLLPVRETQGVRNGAEVILRSIFDAAVGAWGAAAFGAVMLGVAAFLVVRDIKANGAPDRGSIYVMMMLESIVLAAVFAVTASLLTQRVLGALHLSLAVAPALAGIDAPTRFMVSLGAGIFEELLFRVVLVSALIGLSRVLLGAGPRMSAAIAVVLSAFIFSAFHYIGPFGDTLALPSFLFRTIAGLLFSLIYVLRGFGIVAWTHALYDVGLLLLAGP